MIQGATTGPPTADLDSRTQVHDMVVAFYRAIVFDEVLEPVFDEIAEVDWASHIPRLVDYWCRILLADPTYSGAMLAAHQHVDEREPFRPEWFDRWHQLFVETVDAGWTGPGAEHAKAHAERTLESLARRLMGTGWSPRAGSPPEVGAGADA